MGCWLPIRVMVMCDFLVARQGALELAGHRPTFCTAEQGRRAGSRSRRDKPGSDLMEVGVAASLSSVPGSVAASLVVHGSAT